MQKIFFIICGKYVIWKKAMRFKPFLLQHNLMSLLSIFLNEFWGSLFLTSRFFRHMRRQSSREPWLEAVGLLSLPLQALSVKLPITMYSQNLTVDFPSIDCIPSGMIGHHFSPFFPRKRFPLELSRLYSLEEMLGYCIWSEVFFSACRWLSVLDL